MQFEQSFSWVLCGWTVKDLKPQPIDIKDWSDIEDMQADLTLHWMHIYHTYSDRQAGENSVDPD